ncbi:MAG TPA: magnesium/cobalt transporter CorA [Candidatus Omnitrophota bacterium]|nr:magnesium/cobalt transporter CorA [Candidatus Omnitrophota bacterium]
MIHLYIHGRDKQKQFLGTPLFGEESVPKPDSSGPLPSGEGIAGVSLNSVREALQDPKALVWMDFDKPTEDEFRLFSDFFNFHPLAVEDCANVRHHPKIDDYTDYLFMILHAPDLKNETEQIRTCELDIFIGKNFVVTHHVKPISSVKIMQERCSKSPDLWMRKGADFFLYALLDHLMETYEPLVEDLGEEISWAEEEVFFNPDDKFLKAIFDIKKDVFYIRSLMSRQRDTISILSKERFAHISEKARLYFRDTCDVLIRFMDTINVYHERLNSTVETYLIFDNNRLNQVMKGLTVIASVMLPLTVITGIYGMNFRFMPEIQWEYGYFVVLGGMLLTATGTILFMRHKKWL